MGATSIGAAIIHLIHEWFSRSGLRGIYLSINLDMAQEHIEIATAFTQHFPRILHLRLCDINEWFDSHVFREDLPRLEILEIKRWAKDPELD
jgi:hypothetical protein